MAYYLLLTYYDDYVPAAIELYEEFRRSTPGLELIIIDNSKNQGVKADYPTRTVLPGDNRLFEFSGWQKGIDFLRSHGQLKVTDVVFFANDTAGRHRYFTMIDRWLFYRALAQATKAFPCFIVGEVNHSKEPFTASNHVFSRWVSTYFFACSGSFLERINYDLTFRVSLNTHIAAIEERRIVHTHEVPPELSAHINNWLFPDTERKGWYKANHASPAQKAAKSLTIICERRLSASAASTECKLIDVYSSTLAKKYKRRMNRLFRLWRKRP